VFIVPRFAVVFWCLLAWCFSSWVVITYWDYPSVTTHDRLAKAETLDASRIRAALDAAWAKLRLGRMPSGRLPKPLMLSGRSGSSPAWEREN
jgi:hypothetical protein